MELYTGCDYSLSKICALSHYHYTACCDLLFLNSLHAVVTAVGCDGRWWKSVQRCEELEEFLDKILQELYRRELLLARQRRPHATVAQLAFAGDRSSRKQQQSSDVAGEDDEDGEDVDVGRGWDYEGRLLWAQRDRTHAVEVIRDMCDFQVAVMKHSHSFQAGEKFIQERPEEVRNAHFLLLTR